MRRDITVRSPVIFTSTAIKNVINVVARAKRRWDIKLAREWFFLPSDTIDYLSLLQNAKRKTYRDGGKAKKALQTYKKPPF